MKEAKHGAAPQHSSLAIRSSSECSPSSDGGPFGESLQEILELDGDSDDGSPVLTPSSSSVDGSPILTPSSASDAGGPAAEPLYSLAPPLHSSGDGAIQICNAVVGANSVQVFGSGINGSEVLVTPTSGVPPQWTLWDGATVMPVIQRHERVVVPNDSDSDDPALIHAIRRRLETVALRLLDHGANPNATDSEGSALTHAIRRRLETVVLGLLDHGANPNATDREGSALTHAIRRRLETVVSRLLECGANPSLSGDTRRR